MELVKPFSNTDISLLYSRGKKKPMGKVNAGSSGWTGQVTALSFSYTHAVCLYTQQSLLTTFTTNKTYDLVSNDTKSTKKGEKTQQTSHELHSNLLNRICHQKQQKCFGYWHQRADERHGNHPARAISSQRQSWKTPGELGVNKSMECDIFLSVLWHCWLGNRKGIRPVKNWMLVCWWWRFDWSFAWLIAPVVEL